MTTTHTSRRFFNRGFWKSIELKYYLIFLSAVFFTFSIIGYVSDLLNNLSTPYGNLYLGVIIAGIAACMYGFAATKKPILIPAAIVVHFLMVQLNKQSSKLLLTPESTDAKLIFLSLGIIFSMVCGYILFIIFISKVGAKHFALKAEMELAKKINEILVPEIDKDIKGFELYGVSIPASEMGGDLQDVIEEENGLLCISADVSGHGVPSGIYMGMFKSSVRAISGSDYVLDDLIRKVNETLVPLIRKDMFITTSMIKLNINGEADYTVAGHLPILHFSSADRKVNELSLKQIPLGMKTGFEFKSSKVNFQKGDIFALITDGITETRSKDSKEFGIEIIKEMLLKYSSLPVKEISGKILTDVYEFGKQKDDITILLVRC